jgi:hypothetical protein
MLLLLMMMCLCVLLEGAFNNENSLFIVQSFAGIVKGRILMIQKEKSPKLLAAWATGQTISINQSKSIKSIRTYFFPTTGVL